MRIIAGAVAVLGLSILPVAGAFAKAPPPQNAKPLSVLLQSVEARPGFHYIDEIDWSHGTYEVEYVTQSGAEVELHINPVTGNASQSH